MHSWSKPLIVNSGLNHLHGSEGKLPCENVSTQSKEFQLALRWGRELPNGTPWLLISILGSSLSADRQLGTVRVRSSKSWVSVLFATQDLLKNLVWVWIACFARYPCGCVFLCGSRALFTGPASTDFSKFFFKTGSHGTIHTFKNYFAIVFSVFNNKCYPNRPLDWYFALCWRLSNPKALTVRKWSYNVEQSVH